MADTIQTLPGKKSRHNGALKIELTPENLAHITIRHPEIEMDETVKAWYIETIKTTAQVSADVTDYPFKTKPYQHQTDVMELFGGASWFFLMWEMGAGKSKATIDIAGYKYLQGEIENLVVLAPNGVHRQWILEQIPEHLPDIIPRSVIFTTGGTKARNIGVDEIISRKGGLRVFSVNVESISHKSGKALLRKIIESGRSMVVVDESSSIKGYDSARTETMHEIARMENCVVRACLDGTPISQGAEDVYGPLEFLSPTILQCPNWFAFKARYLIMDPNNKRKIVQYRNLEDLQRRMFTCSSRILKKDCLDLPGCVPMTRYVEMTEEQEKYYTDMRELFLSELKTGEVVTVDDAMVRIGKLQQILGGFVITKHEDGLDDKGRQKFRRETTVIGSGKFDAVLDIIREHDKKVIVWVNFREEADLLEAHLKRNLNTRILRYTGKEGDDERTENKRAFRQDPDAQVLICSMAGTRGLNMPECSLMIWFSFPRKLLDYLQGNERTDRPGQTEVTTIVHLMVPKTVDERAFKTLMRKEEFAHMMLDVRDFI